jgi:hypothetical protein
MPGVAVMASKLSLEEQCQKATIKGVVKLPSLWRLRTGQVRCVGCSDMW